MTSSFSPSHAPRGRAVRGRRPRAHGRRGISSDHKCVRTNTHTHTHNAMTRRLTRYCSTKDRSPVPYVFPSELRSRRSVCKQGALEAYSSTPAGKFNIGGCGARRGRLQRRTSIRRPPASSPRSWKDGSMQGRTHACVLCLLRS